ncbi:MAG: ABC transporter ATP-binding protein [Parasporobacterium sp.]|nr:ABC transporter ATP-binding protein [Parasporobacterium sp.]
MSELLDIRDLVVEYHTEVGTVHAVNGISIQMKTGDTLGFVGETGAGKTTTALSILRLLQIPPARFASGEIWFDGKDLLKVSEKEMRSIRGSEIAMIFQDPMTALNPVIPVGQQIAEVLIQHNEITKAQSWEMAEKMLEKVGIPAARANNYPHQFSGGMKQRVVIAMALACTPKLIIADEPTTALDVTIQAQILDMMKQLKEDSGTSILLITHDLGVVAETCDKVAIVYGGEVVEYGSLEQIFDRTTHPYTVCLFGALPSLDKKVDMLTPIEGQIYDAISPPSGCRFHPRCPHAAEECSKKVPDVVEVEPGHPVRCLYANRFYAQNAEGRR